MATLSRLSSSIRPTDNLQLNRHLKVYNPDQQLKYLHLEAEVEVLLQQVQALKWRENL